jgi:3-dehydroquinate synthase
MVLAARTVVRASAWPRPPTLERLNDLLVHLGLPTRFPTRLPTRRSCSMLMRLDKKSLSGKLRLILWRGIGRAEVVSAVPDAKILETLKAGGAS